MAAWPPSVTRSGEVVALQDGRVLWPPTRDHARHHGATGGRRARLRSRRGRGAWTAFDAQDGTPALVDPTPPATR